jgi:hypothetical protein
MELKRTQTDIAQQSRVIVADADRRRGRSIGYEPPTPLLWERQMAHRTLGERKRWPPTKIALERLIAEATVDADGEYEQRSAFYTMIETHLAVPFDVEVLGGLSTVDRVDLTRDDRIVAIVKRGRLRQAIDLRDLPIPNPPPSGAEWIAAFCAWSRRY